MKYANETRYSYAGPQKKKASIERITISYSIGEAILNRHLPSTHGTNGAKLNSNKKNILVSRRVEFTYLEMHQCPRVWRKRKA